MQQTPLARKGNAFGKVQTLREHLEGVAERAEAFAQKFAAGDLGRLCGLLHDIGKFAPEWQNYLLTGGQVDSPGHTIHGAVAALNSRIAPAVLAIYGHHAGLPRLLDARADLAVHARDPKIRQVISLARQFMPELANLEAEIPDFAGKDKLTHELFIRMLFSALVDADRLDAEAHFSRVKPQIREMKPSMAELWERLDRAVGAMSGTGTINKIRREVYDACVKAATLPRGVFRLTVPTGGGKTLSSMAFALRHAMFHKLDRVIVAIPYTSIIDQSADVYRGVLGDMAVLEHHSAVPEPDTLTRLTKEYLWTILAAENWDAPVIVTTTVQFFESLLSNSPSRCRKLHNISRSVIILDEVQTLPTELLTPILDILRQLVRHYGCSVVLCTATQPALDDSPYLEGFKDVREIVPSPGRLFTLMKRVEYEIRKSKDRMTWAEVAEEMKKYDQILVVVNTRLDAAKLIEVLGDPEAYHLSTLMCGAHRREVLAEIRHRLATGQTCRVVSTQLIEAGVDVDFPVVMRAYGPLDRIVQAAGRCNREGKRKSGKVIVFEPAEGRIPQGTYRTATHIAKSLLAKDGVDLHNPKIYHQYFQTLYRIVRENLDAYGIQELRQEFDYPQVAEKFKLIQDDSFPVVVHYAPKSAPGADPAGELLSQIRSNPNPALSRQTWRKLQPYLVQVPKSKFEQYEVGGFINEVVPGLWEWMGKYDPVRGLIPEWNDTEDKP